MDYEGISRRFRPQKFCDVIGQDVVVKILQQSIVQGRLAHAYLFSGSRGTGKTTLARIFAKAINCHNRSQNGEPCDHCPSCLEIMQGKNLDFIEVDGASNRGIEDIRNVKEAIFYCVEKNKFTIYLWDEVHMLTKEAFNALLKVLEEPPPRVKFLFATTEPHKIPATVVSRCQCFALWRIPQTSIAQRIGAIAKAMQVDIEEVACCYIAKLSEGSVRDAEILFDQVMCLCSFPITIEMIVDQFRCISRCEWFALDEAYYQGNYAIALSLAERYCSSGQEVSVVLESLLEHYRNVMAFHLGHLSDQEYFSEEEKKGYTNSKKIYDKNHLLYILDYLSSTLQRTEKMLHKQVHLEMVLLHVLETKKRVSLDQLLHSLHVFFEEDKQSADTLQKQENSFLQKEPDKELEEGGDVAMRLSHANVHDKMLLSNINIESETSLPSTLKCQDQRYDPKETDNFIVRRKQSRYDTLLHFIQVELKGVFYKDCQMHIKKKQGGG